MLTGGGFQSLQSCSLAREILALGGLGRELGLELGLELELVQSLITG